MHLQAYQLTDVYWHVLAARLAFVVVFQNLVALCVMAIKLLVPNVSSDLKERIRREAYLTNEIIIRTELLKAKGKLDIDQEMSEGARDDDDNKGKNDDDESSSCLTRRRTRSTKERTDTGDVTDGNIVV